MGIRRRGRALYVRGRLAATRKVLRPLGKDGFGDLVVVLGDTVQVVVDVGAHRGSMTAAALQAFPGARVLAVEADVRSSRLLLDRFAGETRVEVIEAAAAAREDDDVPFYATATSGTSSLLAPVVGAGEPVAVRTVTLDRICEQRGIDRIDVLKVDVEGAEIEVLQGASGLLARGAVQSIYAEARLVRETEGGVVLTEVADFLAPYGYQLHNLYDLVESEARGIIYGNALFLGADARLAVRDRLGEAAFTRRLGRS